MLDDNTDYIYTYSLDREREEQRERQKQTRRIDKYKEEADKHRCNHLKEEEEPVCFSSPEKQTSDAGEVDK